MNTFELEVWNDEGRYCTLYTVRWDGAEENETNKFFLKYEDQGHKYNWESKRLLDLVEYSIADDYGAIDDFFTRDEKAAFGLPPKPLYKEKIEELEIFGINFPLRLFCYRVSETILIIFNGGEKTANSAQSSALSPFFHDAQFFVKKIEDAFADDIIQVSADERYILDFNGDKDISL